MPTTLDWLRDRDDAALVELLRARPDLAVPAPSELGVLARRLDTPPSVWRAMESLHGFSVQLLQAVVVLGHRAHPVSRKELTTFFGPGVPAVDLDTALAGLETLSLVRGGDPVIASPAAAAALGEFPAGLGPRGSLSERAAAAAVRKASPEARALLDRLAQGQPRGAVPRNGPTAELAAELVTAGLLLQPEPGTVLLPREVCLVLRGDQPLGPVHTRVPQVPLTTPGVRTVDGTAAGQALAAVALAGRLLGLLGQTPAPALKSGGLGVRELRRLTRDLGVEESLVALHLEVLAGAGLIDTSDPRTRSLVSAWTPTTAADDFLTLDVETAWSQLAQVWLDLRRDPSRVGARDSTDKVMAALSAELSWTRGPADRRFVLGALAALPPGSGLEASARAERLAWLAPLRPIERRDLLADTVVAEATALGVVAFGALASAGRAVLADDTAGAAAEMAEALPEPVDRIMVQADLTVIAPGRLEPALAARLAQVAEVESAGSATVYRVTTDSLRRAYDAGVSTGELHQLFGTHSATGVPQSLSYLIDDVARRHGVLRIGEASSYLRSEDPALIDAAVAHAAAAGIRARRLAPTVAVSTSRIEDLLEVLRKAGLVPAAEDAAGGVVDLAPRPQRTREGLRATTRRREPPPPSPEQLQALVTRMRSADGAGSPEDQAPAESLALLRHAADHREAVWIGYVNSEGSTTRRMIEPIAVSGGTVAAFDRLRQTMRTFALHRISGVSAVGSSELGAPASE